MVKIGYLDAFETYKTKPPIIMHEDTKNRKKGHAYIVAAHSTEEEFEFLSTNKDLVFRHLYRYYIDKKAVLTLYGAGKKLYKPNENGEITTLLEKHQKGNLKNVSGVTSYLPSAKTRPLKDFNVLVEVSYLMNEVITNAADRRLPMYKVDSLMNIIMMANTNAKTNLGNYQTHLIIPMALWFTKKDYANPNAIMKTNSKNYMAHILRKICELDILNQFNDVVLVHDNYVLVLNAEQLPEGGDAAFVDECIHRFMTKARLGKEKAIEHEEEIDPETETKMTIAEKKTRKDIATDNILTQSGVDPDAVSEEKREKIQKVVDKSVDVDTDVKMEDITIQDPDDVDVLLAAKTEGKSVQSYKRDQMLKEKYKDLSIGNVPLKDLVEDEQQYTIEKLEPKAKVIHEDLKEIKSKNFEKSYNDNLADKDLANILMHFSTVDPPLYLIKDVVKEDISDDMNRLYLYTAEYEDSMRKRHRIKFKLPKPYKDKYFWLNGAQLNLSHQKLPFPVSKVGPDNCQAVTNYRKIFMERYGSNISPTINQLKKIFAGPNPPKYCKVDTGNAIDLNKPYLTVLEYDDICQNILRLTLGKTSTDVTKIYFIVDDARVSIDMSPIGKFAGKVNEQPENILPLATRKNGKITTNFYISGSSSLVYDQTGKSYGELSEFIVEAASWYDPKIKEQFDKVSVSSKYMYTRCKVMAEFIPTILFLSAVDPNHLFGVMDKAHIKYEVQDKLTRDIDRYQKGVIQFSDAYLIYDRYPFENSLLLNGLNSFPTKEYSIHEMNTRDAYIQIFDTLYNRRTLIDGLENFYYLFIDPITMDVLIRLNMPTDFTRLLLYCNGTLADNTYQIDSDYHNSRIRSNEIIMSYLYLALADAWGRYRTERAEKFSVPEDAVIKSLLTANIADPHTQLNLTLELENDNLIKLKGPSGMNEDRSFTMEKRAYHPSMMGLVGANSTPSGEVGIGRHMTTNANIDDARGFITVDKKEYGPSELMTPGEMLQPFTLESADMERTAMGLSQSKHLVPVENSQTSPVSFDMERVAPYLSSDYAFTTKKPGKVVSIDEGIMVIQYDDGTYDDVDMNPHPAKNTDGGFYIMNEMVPRVKVGQKVDKDTIVAYNPKYINDFDMFGDPIVSTGTVTRITLETNGGVYEDACFITEELAEQMKTNITRQKRVILSKNANIRKIAKVGDKINAGDILIAFDDTKDEFSSKLLSAMAQEIGDDEEVILTSAPVRSKITGTIKDIDIVYVSPIEEMTPSMQKIINDYIKTNKKKEKALGKYKDIYDGNTITKPTSQQTPDGLGRVAGVKITEGIWIDFYIEYEDTMAVADKLTFYSPLKGVVSDVIPRGYEAYTVSNPDVKIGACLSCIGMYKRMCLDLIKVGGMNKILIEKKRMLKAKYHDRIKAELKKK